MTTTISRGTTSRTRYHRLAGTTSRPVSEPYERRGRAGVCGAASAIVPMWSWIAAGSALPDLRLELFPDVGPLLDARVVLLRLELGQHLVGHEDRRVGEHLRVDVLLCGVIRRRVLVGLRLQRLLLRLVDEIDPRVRGDGVRGLGEEDPGVQPEHRPIFGDVVDDVGGLRLVAELEDPARPGQAEHGLL